MSVSSKLSIAALAAFAAFAAPAAHAAVNLVTNGSFESTSLTSGQKAYFTNAAVTGWSGGAKLTFLDAPGTADNGSYLSVYSGFPTNSPDGGFFVEADGDPSYSSAIYQTISGLTVGSNYLVTFYQAAGQQVNFTGPTTEQWKVTFGSQTKLSDKYSLAQGATGAWQAQSMLFTATATSQVLSFLAVGTPNGAPPISFLDGVSVTDVPEPATLALVGLGAVGMLAARRRGQRTAA